MTLNARNRRVVRFDCSRCVQVAKYFSQYGPVHSVLLCYKIMDWVPLQAELDAAYKKVLLATYLFTSSFNACLLSYAAAYALGSSNSFTPEAFHFGSARLPNRRHLPCPQYKLQMVELDRKKKRPVRDDADEARGIHKVDPYFTPEDEGNCMAKLMRAVGLERDIGL